MISYRKKDEENPILLNQEGEVPYFYYPLLENTGMVRHGFSTRLGGVSSGEFESMNFNTTRGDSLDHVEENFRRFCGAIGCDWDLAVMSHQTHTVNVEKVTADMVTKGRSFWEKKPFTHVDGLVTDVPGAVLITSYADCVPLYFVDEKHHGIGLAHSGWKGTVGEIGRKMVEAMGKEFQRDPVKKVIGLSHSGWRGTVERMGAVTVAKMQKEYGCDPADILACVGPSICQDCYEIGPEVAEEFYKAFTEEEAEQILAKNQAGRYQLDLWKANALILERAGIRRNHMAITNVCTCCNPDLLFSHRYTKGKRGNLSAFLSLC